MLRNKSEAFKAFFQFKTHVELQLDLKIKSIQSDWGGEYRAFTNFLQDHGIHHRISCPESHKQNGPAERKHRHITEMGLALLAKASMPLHYWDETFRTSVYLINRLPTPNLEGKSPTEALFNTSPHCHTLKTFGCSCYPNIRSFNKHELQFRSMECTFIGYSLNHKGYKCLEPNGRVIISRNVIFNETSFPFSKRQVTADNLLHTTNSCTSANIPLHQSQHLALPHPKMA